MLSKKIKQYKKDYLDSKLKRIFIVSDFLFDDKVSEILGPMPDEENYMSQPRSCKSIGTDGVIFREEPILSKEQEQHVFKQMNYYKFMAFQARQNGDMENCNRFVYESDKICERIIAANCRIVFDRCKAYSSSQSYEDYISESFLTMKQAIEYFDWRRNYKFSTYCTFCIKNKQTKMFVDFGKNAPFQGTGAEIDIDVPSMDNSTNSAKTHEISSIVKSLSKSCEYREAYVISMRFYKKLTLEEIGKVLNISKERVRQIERKALDKMKILAKEKNILFESYF